MKQNIFNRTTRVEAVIKNIETVLEKSRNLLLDNEIHLLEESLKELRKLDKKSFDTNDLMAISRVIIDLLRLFEIEKLFSITNSSRFGFLFNSSAILFNSA